MDTSALKTVDASQPPLRRKRLAGLAPAGAIGALFCLGWLLVAVVGPWLAPHPVGEVVSDGIFDTISGRYPFGTDYLGL